MEIATQIAEKLQDLPPEKQREVLDFVDFLSQRRALIRPRRDPEGLWADLGIDISEGEIDDARKELWAAFPRDDL
jgi:hypothetical protein